MTAYTKDYEARCQLTWAANLAHNDTVGVGRVVDGTVHGIESEIGGMYNSVHGAGCACVTPAWMKYVYKADPRRFVRYFNQVWGMEVDPYDQDGMIEEGIQRQKDFYVSVGIPVHSSELGVRDEDTPTLVSTVRRGPNGKAGHFMELDDQDLTNIIMLMKYEPIVYKCISPVSMYRPVGWSYGGNDGVGSRQTNKGIRVD